MELLFIFYFTSVIELHIDVHMLCEDMSAIVLIMTMVTLIIINLLLFLNIFVFIIFISNAWRGRGKFHALLLFLSYHYY